MDTLDRFGSVHARGLIERAKTFKVATMRAAKQKRSAAVGGGRRWLCAIASVGALLAAADGFASDEAPALHTLLALHGPQETVRVHRFRLGLARLHVDVVDLAYTTPVADALGDGELIVNGGFWGWLKDDRHLIGLLQVGGKQLSPLRVALEGGILFVRAGVASIAPSRGFHSDPSSVDFAVQCRPRLVQAGAVVAGLNDHARSARTAVCVRDGGHTLDVYLTDPTQVGASLQDLALFLLAQGCEHALNLDGGPSTAAGFRENGRLIRIGAGTTLPYAIRFKHGV
jgi:hypothetical protein